MSASLDRVTVNRKAIRQIMGSPAAVSLVRRKAGAIARACNTQSSWGGYRVTGADSPNRARAVVYNISRHGQRDESRNNRMVKNLDAGRD